MILLNNHLIVISLLFANFSFTQLAKDHSGSRLSSLLKQESNVLILSEIGDSRFQGNDTNAFTQLSPTASQVRHTNLEEQFNFAKNLYEEEKYYDAVTEFKRLKYFDENNIYEFIANEYIALSYKQGGKFNEAIQYFTIAEINAGNNEDLFRVRTEIIRTNILRKTTANALKLLDELSNDKRWIDKVDEIHYWRGWAYIFSDEWDKASKEFSEISPDHELKILCEETHSKKYSVTFAKIVSVILPGAGQFYTGNYINGLLSLGWTALWGYVAVNAFVEDRIFDGLAVTNFLWFRFYRGNLQNAEKFVIEKNIEIVNESLYYLQHIYKGEQP